jgi:hypothetical protein
MKTYIDCEYLSNCWEQSLLLIISLKENQIWKIAKEFRDFIVKACTIKWDLLNNDELFDLVIYWLKPENVSLENANELTKKILTTNLKEWIIDI